MEEAVGGGPHPHPIAVNERMELVEANADLSVRQLWSAEVFGFRTPKASLRWAQRPAIRSLTAIKSETVRFFRERGIERWNLCC